MKRSLLISSAFALALSPAAMAGEKDDRFSDDHARIDAQVRTSGGEDLGTVERVRFASDSQSEIDAYVVETGGFLEIGGREILIDANETDWTGTGDDQVLMLNYTATQVASLPTFDEDRATDYWLADADWADTDDGEGRDRDHDRTQTAAADTSDRYGDAEVETRTRMAADTRTGMDAGDDTWNRNVTPATWDIEDWTDSTVYLSEGDQLGVVTDVRTDDDGVRALIIETDTDYDIVEDELEIVIEDVLAVRENGTRNEVQVASSVAATSDY